MPIIVHILSLLLLAYGISYVEQLQHEDFCKPLKTRLDVWNYLETKTIWAGDRVVDNGIDIVMTGKSHSYTFHSCLEELSLNSTNKRVIFEIESPSVLLEIAPLFNDSHDFVFLLLRIRRGPNGKKPVFGSSAEFYRLFRNLNLHPAVNFGIAFTSMWNGTETGYKTDHFRAIKRITEEVPVALRFKLVEFDFYHICHTDIDIINEDILNFRYILIRSETWRSEYAALPTDCIRKLNMMTSLLSPPVEWIYDVTDMLRHKIFPATSSGRRRRYRKNKLALFIYVVVFWRGYFPKYTP